MKTMGKLLLLCLVGCMFTFAGCMGGKILAKPEDTSLEFWVAQDVSGVDFSEYYYVPAFGADIYYGKGYYPSEIKEDSEIVAPEHCIVYTVTAYPDYSSGGRFVTRIEITDPKINVYGINCNSDMRDFDETFKNLGCTVQDKGLLHIATYGKVNVALASYDGLKALTVSVEVTNKEGIQF